MLGWTADPYLYWVFELYVAGKGSPSKLVQHSGALSDLFGKHVAAMQECPVRNSRINKMKYAKQRFSSTAVPLQRSVLFFEAVWRFLVDVQTVRCGTEPGRHASHFLTNATAESLIQAAMMAEGADEHVQFRRFFDSDRWDATGAGMEIQRFLNNLSHLFIAPPGGQAACLRHGFVKYALDMLRTPHVCWSGGSQHVMGGPGAVTDAIVDRCLSRMANWLRLTVSAASAEFPRWQLVNALDALNLARHCSQQRDADGDMAASTKVNLERLAKAFDLDIHLLTEEFNTCLPGAKNASGVRALAPALMPGSTRCRTCTGRLWLGTHHRWRRSSTSRSAGSACRRPGSSRCLGRSRASQAETHGIASLRARAWRPGCVPTSATQMQLSRPLSSRRQM